MPRLLAAVDARTAGRRHPQRLEGALVITLPLSTPYDGASTIVDATGATVAECPSSAVAEALIAIVNDGWNLSTTIGENQNKIDMWQRSLHASITRAQQG
jgi:hypothetical protein